MKVLVIGGGSIGKRHLANLRMLGLTDLALVEPDAERRGLVCSEVGAAGFGTEDEGLRWRPEAVVVASPSHLHVRHALAASERGCHLFVEKPLSHTDEGLNDLAASVERKGIVSLVGCNMRFHPGPAKVKELLGRQAIGRLLFGRLHTGSYLPGWRPWQDYRGSYSARRDMGGGCILDCIHEIDLARWYGGEVDEVFCVADHRSSLEIETEDYAFLLCRHANGATSEVHLDYCQRTYERGCQIVGEKGSIFWDFRLRTVRWYDAEMDRWSDFPEPDGWELNRMYVEEMAHFLACVERGTPTTLPIGDAVNVMRVAFAAKRSSLSGRFEPTIPGRAVER